MDGWIVGFIVFSLIMSATPGPNNTMLAASGAAFGFTRTIPHMIGIMIGFPIMLVLVGFGVGEALATVPFLIPAMQAVGALMLLWLAWQIAKAPVDDLVGEGSGSEGSGPERSPSADQKARPMTVVEAAAFQWVNPKAWMIAAGAMATFAYSAEGSGAIDPFQLILMGLVFFVASIPCVAVWAGFGSVVRRLLPTALARRRFNQAMALLLVASIGLALL